MESATQLYHVFLFKNDSQKVIDRFAPTATNVTLFYHSSLAHWCLKEFAASRDMINLWTRIACFSVEVQNWETTSSAKVLPHTLHHRCLRPLPENPATPPPNCIFLLTHPPSDPKFSTSELVLTHSLISIPILSPFNLQFNCQISGITITVDHIVLLIHKPLPQPILNSISLAIQTAP